MFNFEKATQPTIYFIGVTTGSSSIMKVFPEWAKAMGIPDAVIKGIDIEIHAEPEVYRKVVDFIKHDELSYGALVTTHKLDLYKACSDMFEYLDPYALMFGEMSSISKKDGKLCGHAKDPISSGYALNDFVPKNWWKDHGGDFYVIGAAAAPFPWARSSCARNLRATIRGGSSVPTVPSRVLRRWRKSFPS